MLGILPFLIQWMALSQFGTQDYITSYYQPNQPNGYQPNGYPPKSHWSLLQDFQNLPEEEIEHFLPQVVGMILDREALNDDELLDYFESIVEKKCANSFTFGSRVCGLLRGTQEPSERGLKSLLGQSQTQAYMRQRREDRLRSFQERAEAATSQGPAGPLSQLRQSYYADFQFLLDTLARLGAELRTFPGTSPLSLSPVLCPLSYVLCPMSLPVLRVCPRICLTVPFVRLY
ncbi:hypothetical protein B484DRAFT_265015, partial [Ochromonadaceae sp. CCMP2298]